MKIKDIKSTERQIKEETDGLIETMKETWMFSKARKKDKKPQWENFKVNKRR